MPKPVSRNRSYYKHSQVIILWTDSLNKQDCWYLSQSSIDARRRMTCANIKAAGITLCTVQANTGGKPISTLLQELRQHLGQILSADQRQPDGLDVLAIEPQLSKLRILQ